LPFLGRLSVTKVETADDLVKAVDRYAERLWRARLPIAASAATTTLRLIWLTAGFSVSANRVCAGDYVCALDPRAVARRTHPPLSETGDAVDALIDAGRLEPLPAVRARGTAFRLERLRARALAPFHERTVIDGVKQSP
jgi:hypothetical protein